MPLVFSSALQTHLDGELQTLASLWTIERNDGEVLRFTDHDRDLVFEGATYLSGIGYDRSAIEDKVDLSVDNMEIKGILDGTLVKRNDVRGGLFDGARVTIQVVNYKDLSMGSIVRRTGWLGTARQNNLGEFDVELRGLSQALSEGLTLVYTPACPVDLGSTKCQVPVLTRTERQSLTTYATENWMIVSEYPDYVWKCTSPGQTEDETILDFTIFDVGASGVEVTDGSVTWVSNLRYDRDFTVTSVTNRKAFSVTLTEPRLADYPDWFQEGALLFNTGANASVSKGIKFAPEGSTGDVEIELHLRLPFEVQVGDTGTAIPGCSKTVPDCGNKFGNVLNFQGHPYVPGDNYLKKYTNAK